MTDLKDKLPTWLTPASQALCHIGNLLKFNELVENQELMIGTFCSDIGGVYAGDKLK